MGVPFRGQPDICPGLPRSPFPLGRTLRIWLPWLRRCIFRGWGTYCTGARGWILPQSDSYAMIIRSTLLSCRPCILQACPLFLSQKLCSSSFVRWRLHSVIQKAWRSTCSWLLPSWKSCAFCCFCPWGFGCSHIKRSWRIKICNQRNFLPICRCWEVDRHLSGKLYSSPCSRCTSPIFFSPSSWGLRWRAFECNWFRRYIFLVEVLIIFLWRSVLFQEIGGASFDS